MAGAVAAHSDLVEKAVETPYCDGNMVEGEGDDAVPNPEAANDTLDWDGWD